MDRQESMQPVLPFAERRNEKADYDVVFQLEIKYRIDETIPFLPREF